MVLVEQLPAESYLRGRHIRFEVAPHMGVYTAKSEADVLGIPTSYVLKVVVLRVGEEFVMAVVPASRMVDLGLAEEATRHHVRLATEDEIVSRFPGIELGALPPLPGLFGIRALVDPAILDRDEVAFADGKQTESFIASPRELFWGEDVLVVPIARNPEVWGLWGWDGKVVSFG